MNLLKKKTFKYLQTLKNISIFNSLHVVAVGRGDMMYK